MRLSMPIDWINLCWLFFGLYWLVSAFNRKATKKKETYLQRFGYTLPLLVGFYFLFRPETHRYPWLGVRFVPFEPA